MAVRHLSAKEAGPLLAALERQDAVPRGSRGRKAKRPSEKSKAEEMLWLHLRTLGQQHLWSRQVRFHPVRMWRFDFGRKDIKLAVEVQGIHRFGPDGKPTKHPGYHRSAEGIEIGCEKGAEALCLGWRVLHVTTGQVKSGQALEWIERLTRA